MSRDRVRIEALESRLLLAAQVLRMTPNGLIVSSSSAAGSISGKVFQDNNSSGAQDAGENGIAGITVFLDLNHSNTFDAGDSSAVSNGGGNYNFGGLADGTYSVGQLIHPSYVRISPEFQAATVTNANNVVCNWFDFPTVLAGTNGSDQWIVRMDPNNSTRFQCIETLLGQPAVTYSITKSLLNSFTINANSGDDQLTVDYLSNGNPIPTGGLNYDANSQSTSNADRITIVGSGGPDQFILSNYDGGQGAGAIAIKAVEKVTVLGGDGNDSLSFKATDSSETLTLGAGAITMNTCTVEYPNLENLSINMLGGNDLVIVPSTASGTPTTVNGGNGNDTLEIDVTTLAPVVFNGGTLASDHDILNVNVGTFTLNSDAQSGTPNLTANVGVDGTLTMNATQHLESLNVAGQAKLSAGGSRVLVTKSLSITGAGRLDLTDNDMIVDYSGSSPLGTWTGSAYSGICGMIGTGYAGDDWDGPGINTSAHTSLTALGCGEASSVLDYHGGPTAVFSNETVDSTAVLVKYTYCGDANLDGRLNIDDYVRIDFALPIHLKVWSNGDFNYDGKINIDDYVEVDFTLPIQGARL